VYSSLKLVIVFLLLSSGYASAHELTPTYVELKQSYVENVLTTSVYLWNGRADVLYYRVNVYDKDMKEVEFFSLPAEIVKLEYTKRQKIDVYMSSLNARKAVYICTRSQILKGLKQKTVVSSKICSKIK
jgi:hypothetical protein